MDDNGYASPVTNGNRFHESILAGSRGRGDHHQHRMTADLPDNELHYAKGYTENGKPAKAGKGIRKDYGSATVTPTSSIPRRYPKSIFLPGVGKYNHDEPDKEKRFTVDHGRVNPVNLSRLFDPSNAHSNHAKKVNVSNLFE